MKVLVDLGLIAAIFIAAAVANMLIIGALVCEINFKKHQVKVLENENADLRIKLSKIKENPLRHMTLCCDVDKRKIIDCVFPETLRKRIVKELADQMHEFIEENMIAIEDNIGDTVKYYCHVWVK